MVTPQWSWLRDEALEVGVVVPATVPGPGPGTGRSQWVMLFWAKHYRILGDAWPRLSTLQWVTLQWVALQWVMLFWARRYRLLGDAS